MFLCSCYDISIDNVLNCYIGGKPGKRGQNILIQKNGRHVNLGSKISVDVEDGVSTNCYPLLLILNSFTILVCCVQQL